MMDSLPVELTFAIFHKVPTKGIGQSMLVSKKWLSHIKNPYFISSYISNNQLLVSQKLETLSFNFDNQEFDCYKNLDPRFVPDCWYTTCLRGIFNGVLWMVNHEQGSIVLWNPTIQKTLTLPCFTTPDPNIEFHRLRPGLVFDTSTNDYKVVTFVKNINPWESGPDYLQVFSLNRNSWRTEPIFTPTHRYSRIYKYSLSFNSVIHWAASDDDRQIILGYDASNEIVREMKLPEVVEDPFYITMSVYKECIIGFCHCIDRDVDIWVMREYSNENSWTKIWTFDVVASLDIEEIDFSLDFCFKQGSTKELILQITWEEDPDEEESDDDEIPIETQRMIMLLDMEKGEQKVVVLDAELLIGNEISYFAESLVLLDHPSAQSYIPVDH